MNLDPESDLARQVAAVMLSRDAMSRSLGIAVVEVRPGYARVEMQIQPEMLNSHAICHGGVIFTFADSAFAFACNSHNRSTVASSASIDFISPAQLGEKIIAEATERTLTGRLGFYDVQVTESSGRLVALFRGRSYRISGESLGPIAGSDSK
ncbi:MAG: hydroxyphenylacetyl-CoA thioesterase PaaI [Verrucomicrobia bacterium]|nr:hydroxyphenylacetyl-CoA thioesterase PaaI [Verrucomicrobiota bacterium]MBV9272807.1 hydroxyphenylacetyl-CoA thioesterase PaaI [Verrucomicrobiota bacterium]